MLTPAYALTASERILPSMALDFTSASLDARVAVTRATSASNPATYVNSSGVLTAATDNQPRFDYDAATLTCKGLLVEASATNRLTYSADFSNGVWTPTGATIESDALTAPDGTTTADNWKINSGVAVTIPALGLFTAGILARLVTTSTFALSAVANTYSLFVRAGSGLTHIQLRVGTTLDLTGASQYGTIVRLSDGFVVYTDGTTIVTNMGGGWYRIALTFTPTANNYYFGAWVWNSTSKTTNGTEYISVWGAQLETGSAATSYIPTTATSLTRNADVALVSGANFSGWWQATTGSMATKVRPTSVVGTRPLVYISDGTANNIITLRGNATNPELYVKATTDQVTIDAGTLTANTQYGLVGSWTTDNCAAAVNGEAAVTDTSATIPTVDRMLIGSDGANYLNGHVEKISFWPMRVTNAETQAFSKV